MKFLGGSRCFRQIQDEKQQTNPGSGGKIYQETLTNPGSVSKLREAPESWSSWRPKLTGCSRLACCSLRVFAHVCCRWYPYAFLVDTHIPWDTYQKKNINASKKNIQHASKKNKNASKKNIQMPLCETSWVSCCKPRSKKKYPYQKKI